MARRRHRRRRRPPWWLLVLTVVAVVAIGILLTSGKGSSKPRLAVRAADVPAAVRAVEAKLGGAQRFTEVNAGVDVVNVFVAGPDGTESPWQFGSSGLEGPAPSQAAGADHPAFALDGVDIDRADRVAREATDQFPTATMTRFALRRASDGSVVWSVGLRSAQGGLIEVTFAGDGRFLGADLR